MKSMTGYGKAHFVAEGVSYLLEIHSVNRKSLDMVVFLPRDMLPLDIELRKWIGQHVKRGQVTLKLTKEVSADAVARILPEIAMLKAFKKSWEHLAQELGYQKEDLSLPFLMGQLDTFPKAHQQDLQGFSQMLEKAFHEAVGSFLQMKQTEGNVLASEMKKSLEKIRQCLKSIGNYAQEVAEEYRKKMVAKFQEFDLASDEMKEKIVREVVLYVDKGDITEEIGRLSAHLMSFEDKMHSDDAVGKPLDFIVLEMNREANTMAAKSQQLHVTTIALAIKSEVEKIREQIQNIE